MHGSRFDSGGHIFPESFQPKLQQKVKIAESTNLCKNEDKHLSWETSLEKFTKSIDLRLCVREISWFYEDHQDHFDALESLFSDWKLQMAELFLVRLILFLETKWNSHTICLIRRRRSEDHVNRLNWMRKTKASEDVQVSCLNIWRCMNQESWHRTSRFSPRAFFFSERKSNIFWRYMYACARVVVETPALQQLLLLKQDTISSRTSSLTGPGTNLKCCAEMSKIRWTQLHIFWESWKLGFEINSPAALDLTTVLHSQFHFCSGKKQDVDCTYK